MNDRIIELMYVAKSIASGSLDPYKQVGCLILDADGVVISTGINHLDRTAPVSLYKEREKRRPYMIHAELAALGDINRHHGRGHTVIVTLLPCVHCMTALAAFKIKEVYYREAYEKDLMALDVAIHHNIICQQVTIL